MSTLMLPPTISYHWYNYITREFDDDRNHITDMTDKYAKEHIPQHEHAQACYAMLRQRGTCPGESLLLTLTQYS